MPVPTSGPDLFCGDRLFADVETYSGFGDQRTGGAADARTADWIAGRLSAAGLTVRRQPFQVRQFYPTAWGLNVGALKYRASPRGGRRPADRTPSMPPMTNRGPCR